MKTPQYLTLMEMGKRTALLAIIARTIGRASPLLAALRFKEASDKSGESYVETVEEPEAQRRPLNGEFQPSQRVATPGTAHWKIYGGQIGHDRAAERAEIANPLADTLAYATSIRRLVERDLVWGDPGLNPLEFPGLHYWAGHSRDLSESVISAGDTDGGAALSVKLLRDAIDVCDPEPTLIVVSGPMANWVTGAAENTGVSGFVSHEKNDFGTRIAYFDRIPMVILGRGPGRMKILNFNEASAGPTPTATSIYIVSHGRGSGFYPFQKGPIYVDPIVSGGAQRLRDLEWLLGTLAVGENPVVRIRNIGNLPMVR